MIKKAFLSRNIVLILIALAVLLRGIGLFHHYFGVNEYEFLLLKEPSNFVLHCHSEQDCFLPFSLFFITLPNLLGLSIFSTVVYWGRMITFVLGVIWIILAYRIAKKIFLRQKRAAVFFLLVLAISPQFVFLSRFVTPLSIGLPLFIVSLFFTTKALFEKKTRFLLYSALAAAAMLFSSAYAFIPAFILVLLITLVYFQMGKKQSLSFQNMFLGLFFWGAVWFLYVRTYGFLIPEKLFSIFWDIGIINSINTIRGEEIAYGFPVFARLLYNKSYYLVFWFACYLKQFSLNNIFSLVEDNGTSLVIANTPVFLIFAPFFVFGLFKSFFIFSRKKAVAIFSSLLLFALPSSLISSMFNQDSFVFALLPIVFYVGLGLYLIWGKKSARILFIVLLILNFVISYYKIVDDFRRSDRLINQQLNQQVQSQLIESDE